MTVAVERPDTRRLVGPVLVAGAALVLVPVALTLPVRLLALLPVATALVAFAYARPSWAVYVLLGATPLVAGIERGAYLPILRPHEALGLLFGTGVALRALAHVQAGHPMRMRLTRVDLGILAFALTSSVLPLLWLAARGRTPDLQDLLYATTIWKFYGLFLLVRACIRTDHQVRRCLQVSLAAYAVTAVVAMLQALQLFGVPTLVGSIYGFGGPVGVAEGRGTSTLGSSFSVGDVTAFCMAVCLAWWLRERAHRPLKAGFAALFALGAFGSGQFSGFMAVGIAVFAVAALTGYVRRLLAAITPISLVAAVVLRPIVERRLEDLDTATGLPQSWTVRLDNLRLFVWPHVFDGYNWLFGVRPAARIRIDATWGPYIYIESGHTWLLWAGGIPLFAAYLYFSWVAARATWAAAHTRTGPRGVAATAAFAGVVIVFILMSFDPHITMRGTADLLFTLLALAIPGDHDDAHHPPLRPAPARAGDADRG